MRCDFLTLRLFVAVYEERSITKAAKREHIAPSAVSKRLSDLEAEVQNVLFFRRSDGLQPTAAGQAMMRHARAVLHDMVQLEQEMAAFGVGVTGTVRVYANAWAMALHLPRDLQRFLRAHPHVQVELAQEVSPVAIRALHTNDADLAILGADHPAPGCTILPYREEDWVALVPVDHPLAVRHGVRLHDLLMFDFVGVTQGSAIDRLVERQAAQSGVAIRFRLRVSGFETVGAMVEAGLGVSIVPRGWVDRYAGRIRVSAVPLEEPWVRRKLVICLREPAALTAAASLLVEHLKGS